MTARRALSARRIVRGARRRTGMMLAHAALLVGGPPALERVARRTDHSSWGHLPHRWHPRPAPAPVDEDWPALPEVGNPIRTVRTLYRTGERPPRMDKALLAALNEEYRSTPLVPQPLTYDQAAVEARAHRRLTGAHMQVDLRNKRVLEFGCGTGFEVWLLSHHFGADAWGVDVAEREGWRSLADEHTHLVCADITVESPFEPDFFDRVISFTVLEHVVHPYAALSEVFRILKPGGLVVMSANLHRGPKASHLYREIHFPYPHLLFSDDVIREYREEHGGEAAGAHWVNRLTWAQYEDYFREIGYIIRSLRFVERPIDQQFYDRFSDILGRYPRWDLERDFFHVVLEKPFRRRA